MSYVTSVTLICSCAEEFFDDDDKPLPKHDRLNQFFADHHKQPPEFVTPATCRGKHPQTYTFAGGYNYFQTENFFAFLAAFDWEYPDHVVLVMITEGQEPVIWRPSDGAVSIAA